VIHGCSEKPLGSRYTSACRLTEAAGESLEAGNDLPQRDAGRLRRCNTSVDLGEVARVCRRALGAARIRADPEEIGVRLRGTVADIAWGRPGRAIGQPDENFAPGSFA